MPTDEDRHRELQARIQALWPYTFRNNKEYKSLLDQIARENQEKAREAAKRREIDMKLSLVEKEYLEIVKAQEIMDQIDAKNKP